MTADSKILDDRALDILFREARTHKGWKDKEVSDVLLQAVYDLMKWGPTSLNSCPARFIFIRSPEARERLRPHLDPGNVEQTMAAPVTAIIAYDMKFYDKLPYLNPHMAQARDWFVNSAAAAKDTALRNGSLEGAYFIMAARSLGLDCGPMSGFKKDGVKKEFFPDKDWEANFLCNIGYGDPAKLYPRNKRLAFDESCAII